MAFDGNVNTRSEMVQAIMHAVDVGGLQELRGFPPLAVDGAIGPQSRQALSAAGVNTQGDLLQNVIEKLRADQGFAQSFVNGLNSMLTDQDPAIEAIAGTLAKNGFGLDVEVLGQRTTINSLAKHYDVQVQQTVRTPWQRAAQTRSELNGAANIREWDAPVEAAGTPATRAEIIGLQMTAQLLNIAGRSGVDGVDGPATQRSLNALVGYQPSQTTSTEIDNLRDRLGHDPAFAGQIVDRLYGRINENPAEVREYLNSFVSSGLTSGPGLPANASAEQIFERLDQFRENLEQGLRSNGVRVNLDRPSTEGPTGSAVTRSFSFASGGRFTARNFGKVINPDTEALQEHLRQMSGPTGEREFLYLDGCSVNAVLRLDRFHDRELDDSDELTYGVYEVLRGNGADLVSGIPVELSMSSETKVAALEAAFELDKLRNGYDPAKGVVYKLVDNNGNNQDVYLHVTEQNGELEASVMSGKSARELGALRNENAFYHCFAPEQRGGDDKPDRGDPEQPSTDPEGPGAGVTDPGQDPGGSRGTGGHDPVNDGPGINI